MVDPVQGMILLDVFESVELEHMLQQSAVVQRTSLNSMGFADVVMFAHDGHRAQIENKQIDELLGDLDGCESQLRKQYDKAEESYLLIRGIATPAADGIQTFRESSKASIFHKSRMHRRRSYAGYRGWLYSLDKLGVTCIEVPNLYSAAITIVSVYHGLQRQNHSTLRRYIKPKVHLEDYDPYVLTLMGIPGAAIGESRARELVRMFGTPWAVFCRDEGELAEVRGMGRQLARRLLKAIGK